MNGRQRRERIAITDPADLDVEIEELKAEAERLRGSLQSQAERYDDYIAEGKKTLRIHGHISTQAINSQKDNILALREELRKLISFIVNEYDDSTEVANAEGLLDRIYDKAIEAGREANKHLK
jgi:hypothetical protein